MRRGAESCRGAWPRSVARGERHRPRRQRHVVDVAHDAVALVPESPVARNNLALAYAARGDFASARLEFERAKNSLAQYNLGIVYLATRQYAEAVVAFDLALTLNPSSTVAAQRARQARASALAEVDDRDHH